MSKHDCEYCECDGDDKYTKRYLTPEQMPHHYSFVKKGGLRWWIFNAETNGMSVCLRRIGRKILIDCDLFEKWIEKSGEKIILNKNPKKLTTPAKPLSEAQL
jgi:hypothetical protein